MDLLRKVKSSDKKSMKGKVAVAQRSFQMSNNGYKRCIPANHPDFIGTVPIFDFQNLQKSGRPDFLEFQPVSIPIFEVIFKA